MFKKLALILIFPLLVSCVAEVHQSSTNTKYITKEISDAEHEGILIRRYEIYSKGKPTRAGYNAVGVKLAKRMFRERCGSEKRKYVGYSWDKQYNTPKFIEEKNIYDLGTMVIVCDSSKEFIIDFMPETFTFPNIHN